MKKIIQGVVLGLSLQLLFTCPVFAQPQPSNDIQLTAATEPPLFGTFYSMQMTHWPPFPFNPFPDLPLYKIEEGLFTYNDHSVDYVARKKQAEPSSGEEDGGGMAMLSGGPPPPGGGGGGVSNPPPYSVPGLKLRIPVISGANLSTSLMEANTNRAQIRF